MTVELAARRRYSLKAGRDAQQLDGWVVFFAFIFHPLSLSHLYLSSQDIFCGLFAHSGSIFDIIRNSSSCDNSVSPFVSASSPYRASDHRAIPLALFIMHVCMGENNILRVTLGGRPIPRHFLAITQDGAAAFWLLPLFGHCHARHLLLRLVDIARIKSLSFLCVRRCHLHSSIRCWSRLRDKTAHCAWKVAWFDSGAAGVAAKTGWAAVRAGGAARWADGWHVTSSRGCWRMAAAHLLRGLTALGYDASPAFFVAWREHCSSFVDRGTELYCGDVRWYTSL
jgi:hypothetical protein